jgi:pseudouridine synthase
MIGSRRPPIGKQTLVKERVQKLMSQLGIASRRNAEDMIVKGRVRINGKVAKLGDQADPAVDTVEVDGRRLNLDNPKKVYIALHKPKGVITTNVGHKGDDRQTIRELVPHEGHLFTIGRLDADSEGLIVLTNDGEMAQKLSHPSYQHTKTYKVVVQGLPTAATIEKWQQGIMLEEGMTAPASVHIVKGGSDFTTLRIVMTEGKKRQIRRVALILGHQVKRLVRTRIGLLDLGTLKPGEWRELSQRDLQDLATVAPELKSIKAMKRARFSGGRKFDPEARSGRRPRPEQEDQPEGRNTRPPRGFSVDEAAPAGYESDRRPMYRGPGRPSGPSRSDDARPPRRYDRYNDQPTDESRSAGRPPRRDSDSTDRKPMGRGPYKPSRPGEPRSSGRPPRRDENAPSGERASGRPPRRDDDSSDYSDRKPLQRGPGKPSRPASSQDNDRRSPGTPSRGGRPGPKRGRPAANNPHATRRPRPAKRGPKRNSES